MNPLELSATGPVAVTENEKVPELSPLNTVDHVTVIPPSTYIPPRLVCWLHPVVGTMGGKLIVSEKLTEQVQAGSAGGVPAPLVADMQDDCRE